MTKPDWSHDQITILRQLWVSGATSSQISTEIGKTRSAVLGKISRLKLIRNPVTPSAKKVTLIPKNFWFTEKESEFEKLWSDGVIIDEIAKHFGVSNRAVSSKRVRMGLLPRPAGNQNPNRKPKLGPTKRSLNQAVRPKPKPMNAPTCEPVGLSKRTGCAFPVKRTTEHLFCNSTTEKTYCDYHSNLMVQPR